MKNVLYSQYDYMMVEKRLFQLCLGSIWQNYKLSITGKLYTEKYGTWGLNFIQTSSTDLFSFSIIISNFTLHFKIYNFL